MSNRKRLDQLTELTAVNPSDLLYVVDVSDTTDSAEGSSRKVQASNARVWATTAAETAASVTPSDFTYEPGDIRRYGATTGAPNNSSAIQSAVNQAAQSTGADVYIPPGTWTITSGITISAKTNVNIYGDGYNKSSIVVGANSVTALNFTGVCVRCSVKGLWIGSSTARTSTVGISIIGTDSSNVASEFTVSDVKIQNLNSPIVCTFLHQSYFDRIRVVQSVASGVTGVGFNGTTIVSVRIKNYQAFATTGAFGNDGLRLNDDCDTVLLESCEILDATGYAFRLRNPTGSTGPRLIRLSNCYAEEASSAGYLVEGDCRDVRLQGCHAAVNTGDGFSVSAGESIHFVDCIALQNNNHGFSISGGAGVSLSHCDASNNSQATDATYDGINIGANVTNVRLMGCKSGDYVLSLSNGQRYGLTVSGTGTDYIVVSGCDFSGNTTGHINPVTFPGSNNQINYDPGVQTFGANDTTPSVASARTFKTANSSPTTISDFDSGYTGQKITVIINDTNTTVDFTASGLKGNAGVDWSPTTGDHMTCVYDGTDWFCDISDNTA